MDSIIAWVGGKRLLKKTIISRIPKHNTYIEVFGGAAWVLLGKSNEPKDWITTNKARYHEIYNDINGDLVNFWRYIKHHPEAFVTELNTLFVSREMFDFYRYQTPRTELENAVSFYFKIALSFGAMQKDFVAKTRRNLLPLRNLEKVKKAAERFRNITIENKDFSYILKRYDKPESFFYLDPPYYSKEDFYESESAELFTKHEELAEALKQIKGKFLLSYNDDPFIRELYKSFNIEEVETTYMLSGQKKGKVELLINNY